MVYVVAFDGLDLSVRALRRAVRLAEQTDERVLAVSVLPMDRALAEEYGLVEGGEYDPEAAAGRLQQAVESTAPEAAFRTESIDAYAGKGQIAKKIRRVARDEDADIVFVGSDNAGRIVAPVASVGGAVAGSLDYDVFIVRPGDD